jgi:DNA-binding response OmpR family regulator
MSTILVIDDTALARESVSQVLEYDGFRAIKARNGKEAWAMMYHDRPDLVLLDLMMPEMDGVTFLSMLRRSALWHDTPVVVLTGADDREHLITRAWELGVSDLLPKATFGVQDLLGRIKQHLASAEAAGGCRRRRPFSGQVCHPA